MCPEAGWTLENDANEEETKESSVYWESYIGCYVLGIIAAQLLVHMN